MDYKKLDKLNKLRQSGALTEEEFENEKRKLFSENETCNSCSNEKIPFGLQENSYLTIMSFLILVPYIGITYLIFPFIGGVKGMNGQVWKYPLSIPFLK